MAGKSKSKKVWAKKTWTKPEKVETVRPAVVPYSGEQQAVYHAIMETMDNLVIIAAAGSGKTFTLNHAAWQVIDRRPSYRMAYIVFNTRNRAEAEGKFPSSVDVTTLHSLGRKVLATAGRVVVDEHKAWNFLGKMVPDTSKGLEGPELEKEKKAFARRKFLMKKLIDMARIQLMDLTPGDMLSCAMLHDINLDPRDVETAHRVLMEMNRQFWGDKTEVIPTKVLQIDFTDMIYLAVRHADKCKFTPEYDMVMVDEFQDVSRMSYELLHRWVITDRTRTVVVGDRAQAIYGFAGASVEFFGIMQDRPNTQTLTLGTCYRCAPSIIAEARKYVDYIHPWAGYEGEGTVVRDGDYNNAKSGDFILCRKNRPIVKICLDMLGRGLKAVVRGRDIAEQLQLMLEDMDATAADFMVKLDGQRTKWLARMESQRGWTEERSMKSEDYKNLTDRMGVLEDMSRVMAIDQIKPTIDSIFTDAEKVDAVILSTVHKAKGLEAPRVFILDLCQMEEMNLRYVAVTRAQHHLEYCSYEGCGEEKNSIFGF